jgi:hypothetical protein
MKLEMAVVPLKTAPSELPFGTVQEVNDFKIEKNRKPKSVHPAGRYGPLKIFGPWSKPFADLRKMGFFRLRLKCSKICHRIEGFLENLKLKTVFGRDNSLSHKKIKRVPICTCNEDK